MAKRGRKVGGFKIDKLSDREEIANKIINQINSLNKKIKKFRKEGISEFDSFYQQYLGDLVGTTKSGLLSKSKKQFEDMHLLTLKKTLSAVHKINNDPFYGTVKKYNNAVNESLRKVIEFSRKHLEEKGYDSNWVNGVVESKSFIAQLIMSFNESGGRYGSKQQIEKIALNYEADPNLMSKEEMQRIINNIEQSQNAFDRLEEQRREYEEFLAMKNRNNGMR